MFTFLIMMIFLSVVISGDIILTGTYFEKYKVEISIVSLAAMAAYAYFWMRWINKIRKQAALTATPPINKETHDYVWILIPIAFIVLLWGGCVYRVSTPSFRNHMNEIGAKNDLYFNCLQYYSSNPKDCDRYR